MYCSFHLKGDSIIFFCLLSGPFLSHPVIIRIDHPINLLSMVLAAAEGFPPPPPVSRRCVSSVTQILCLSISPVCPLAQCQLFHQWAWTSGCYVWPSAWRGTGTVARASHTLPRLSFSDGVQDQLEDEAVALPTAEGDSSPCLSSLLQEWVGHGHPCLMWGCLSSGDREVKHVAAQRRRYLPNRAEIPLQAPLLPMCLFCLCRDRAGRKLLLFQQNTFLLRPQIMELCSTTKDEILTCTYQVTYETMHLTHTALPQIAIQF